jgi:hypothetical protein
MYCTTKINRAGRQTTRTIIATKTIERILTFLKIRPEVFVVRRVARSEKRISFWQIYSVLRAVTSSSTGKCVFVSAITWPFQKLEDVLQIMSANENRRRMT